MGDELPIVLVVDDDALVREFIVVALTQIGYSIAAASTLKEALDLVKSCPSLRLLLSDVRLKSEAGPELVRGALQIRSDLKVVFMTGGISDVAFRVTDPVLKKPFTVAELQDVVTAALNENPPAGRTPPAAIERRRNIS